MPAGAGCYLKYQISERPLVGVAAVESGTVKRVVVGAVGDLPVVADAGRWADFDPAAVARQAEPVDDLAGSAEYKRHATEVHVRRAVTRMTAHD